MKTIPLFGTGIKSYSSVVTSQRRLNCFYDIRTDQDKSSIVIIGTPGTQTWVSFDGIVYGWIVSGNFLYVVAGNTLYQVSSGGVITSLGSLPTVTQKVGMADNGVQLIIVDGVRGYIYNYNTSTFTGTISDVNFPAGCTTVGMLNSRFVVEKANTRQFYVSAQLDGTLWTPQIYGTKENSSDNLSAVDVLNGVLVLWGLRSIEFWTDLGLSPLPYQRVQGATQTWGLAAKYSRAFLSNSMIFLGQNPQGGVQVLKLSGSVPVPVSTSDLSSLFSGFTTYQDATALTYMVDGHPMYQLTFPSQNRSFLYDDITGMWYETQTGVALQNRHFGDLGIAFGQNNYVSDYQTGNVYQLRSDVYTDNGTPIKRQVVSRHLRNGGNEFSVDEIILDMETGVGLQSGQGSDPQVMLQISKDGGRTFGPERWKSLGLVGQYRTPRVRWARCGQARDFVFQFTLTDPVKFIITQGMASLRPGTEQSNE